MSRRIDSDEAYVLDLCDEIVGTKSHRQKRFEFLRGDPGSRSAGRRLPVDAFYPELMLAVEYREIQHEQSVAHFDKPARLTIGGVHRGEQRRIYDQRRRDLLPAKGIRLIEIDCRRLSHDGRFRLRRDRHADLRALQQMLITGRLPVAAPS